MQPCWQEPSAEAYRQAFLAIRPSITEGQLHMLEAHFLAPGHSMMAIELATAAGYASHRDANRIYPGLGKRLRNFLGIPRMGSEVLVGVFVEFPDRPHSGARWVFKLRAPVVEALAALGWFADSDWDGGSDGELAAAVCREGERYTALRTHRKREQSMRRAKLRAALKAVGHLVCEVPGCGFDFAVRYGRLGQEFAEIHHLVPLSASESVRETSLQDLAVVCSNCHRMIHRRRECLSLEEIGAALAAGSGGQVQLQAFSG